MSEMIEIEFITNFCCYKEGDRKVVMPGFAQVMIEGKKAKRVDKPKKHKMIEQPEKEKRHYYVG